MNILGIKTLFYKGKEWKFEWGCGADNIPNVDLKELEFCPDKFIEAECSQSYGCTGQPPCLHKGIIAKRRSDNKMFLICVE